jgi:uncharacterized protein
MKPNRFLQNAWKAGRMDAGSQVGAIVTTWAFFAVVGAVIQLLPMIYFRLTDPSKGKDYLADPTNFTQLGNLDLIVVFACILGPFLAGLAGIVFSEQVILKKPAQWVMTGFKRFRFWRTLASLSLWMGMMCLYQLVFYAIDPESIQPTLSLGRFFTFLPVALLLIPLQSAFEEIAVRGQLMHGLIRLPPQRPYLPLLMSSAVFALLHIFNPEVQEYGVLIMLAHYFTFGLLLGAIALIDEGLEISIGIHAANNIFSLCLVSYPGTSLETPALFQQQYMAASTDFFVMLVFVAIVYLVFFGKRKNALKAIGTNISTGPAEPEDAFASEAPLS